jgi:hypothetical protein
MSNPIVSSKPTPRRGPYDSAATRQRWIERLQRFHNSNLTVARFCQVEGVSVPAFYQWKRQLKTAQSTPTQANAFLPVRINTAPPTLEVILTSGTLLRFVNDCQPEHVAALLRAVGAIPC